MRPTLILFLTLAASLAARADFSYTSTAKSSGGMMAGAAAAANRTTKTYLKGQKMKMDAGDTVTIMDFDAQTITHIDNNRKTYSVTKFSDLGQSLKDTGADVNISVKETGQRKSINGFNASEVVMSMDVDNPQARQAGMKMHMEMDMWISSDVPGSQELKAFYDRNGGKFPWGALGGGGRGNQGMQKAMTDLQRKMSEMKGVPVLQVVKMGMGGNEAQMAQMQQGMAQARAQLEEMKRQGKLPPQAEEALARMGGGGGASGGSMFEITTEMSGFSTSSIPESTFAIPAGYQQTQNQ